MTTGRINQVTATNRTTRRVPAESTRRQGSSVALWVGVHCVLALVPQSSYTTSRPSVRASRGAAGRERDMRASALTRTVLSRAGENTNTNVCCSPTSAIRCDRLVQTVVHVQSINTTPLEMLYAPKRYGILLNP